MPVKRAKADNLDQLRERVVSEAVKQNKSVEYATRKFSAFDAYCAEAGERLGLPPTADQYRPYASLKLQVDANLEQMLIGQQVDGGAHLKLVEALKGFLPVSDGTHNLTIEFAGPDRCPRCGCIHDGDRVVGEPPKPAKPLMLPAPSPVSEDAQPTETGVSNTPVCADPAPPARRTGAVDHTRHGAFPHKPVEAWRGDAPVHGSDSSLHSTLNPQPHRLPTTE